MLEIKKGDYGFTIEFTVLKADGNPKDLSDMTVTWKVWKDNILKFSRECTITDATNGKCEALVKEGDFDETGMCVSELELTATGYKESSKTFLIEVKPSL
ncbi:MAG: BppU family phage baseplate upper protein [Candidatus Thorarchaeota archaeon]